jgi:hypothetical protein
MKKLRIVTLGFGTGRQRMVLERATNPKRSRRTCSPRYRLQSCRGKPAGVAKRPRERSPTRKPTRNDSQQQWNAVKKKTEVSQCAFPRSLSLRHFRVRVRSLAPAPRFPSPWNACVSVLGSLALALGSLRPYCSGPVRSGAGAGSAGLYTVESVGRPMAASRSAPRGYHWKGASTGLAPGSLQFNKGFNRLSTGSFNSIRASIDFQQGPTFQYGLQ